MFSEFVRFCPLSEVPSGGRKIRTINGSCVLVCNIGDKLFAVSGICSHQQKPLERGRIRNGAITCPVHDARFDLASGAPLDLPATEAIAVYPVRVINDWIEVGVSINDLGKASDDQ